jgi:transcriptional regulator GlxA family with amidase domain
MSADIKASNGTGNAPASDQRVLARREDDHELQAPWLEQIAQTFHFNEPKLHSRRALTLRKAEAFLSSHLTTNFRSRDLCNAVHLGERAVQKLFRAEYGLTPRRWHLLQRMHCVRTDLLQGAFKDITEIAAAWGFLEFGRFAVQYRKLFGERPSETLRRGRVLAKTVELMLEVSRRIASTR